MDSEEVSFVVYIDESGDEGFNFSGPTGNGGSSRWFVISAAVFRSDIELEQVKCVDIARAALHKDASKPLHFRDLPHDKRVAYATLVSRAEMGVVAVMFYKPEIQYRQVFQEENRLYWYAARFLLERVSWLCNSKMLGQHQDGYNTDGAAHVIFSNRKTMSYEQMRDYLRTLRNQKDGAIDWNIINPDFVESRPHAALRGLQIADVLASSFWCAVEHNRFGHTEDRYARAILPRVFSAANSVRTIGYGLKVWPSTAIKIVKQVSDLLD